MAARATARLVLLSRALPAWDTRLMQKPRAGLGMGARALRRGRLVGVLAGVLLAGCQREGSQDTVETASTVGPEETASRGEERGGERLSADEPQGGRLSADELQGGRAEPMRLPFDDFAPAASADPFTYQRTLSPGCALTYQRWWGTPPDPGPPVSQVSVRSARLAGVAAYALVYDVGSGEQRVWRRGEGYQVALAFEGCTEAAVDAVLAGSEALPSRPLGTAMPAAQSVCVGPRSALVLHLATPSRAGTYDPAMPIHGEHLNWTAPGVGCVTYPGASSSVPCGGGSHPWVATTLCQQ